MSSSAKETRLGYHTQRIRQLILSSSPPQPIPDHGCGPVSALTYFTLVGLDTADGALDGLRARVEEGRVRLKKVEGRIEGVEERLRRRIEGVLLEGGGSGRDLAGERAATGADGWSRRGDWKKMDEELLKHDKQWVRLATELVERYEAETLTRTYERHLQQLHLIRHKIKPGSVDTVQLLQLFSDLITHVASERRFSRLKLYQKAVVDDAYDAVCRKVVAEFRRVLADVGWPMGMVQVGNGQVVEEFDQAFQWLQLLQRLKTEADALFETATEGGTKGGGLEEGLLPLNVMVDVVASRFWYHFGNKRSKVCRDDKPEWFCSFVLSCIARLGPFVAEFVQPLVKGDRNALGEFLQGMVGMVVDKVRAVKEGLMVDGRRSGLVAHLVRQVADFDERVVAFGYAGAPVLDMGFSIEEWAPVEASASRQRVRDILTKQHDGIWALDYDGLLEDLDEHRWTKAARQVADVLQDNISLIKLLQPNQAESALLLLLPTLNLPILNDFLTHITTLFTTCKQNPISRFVTFTSLPEPNWHQALLWISSLYNITALCWTWKDDVELYHVVTPAVDHVIDRYDALKRDMLSWWVSGVLQTTTTTTTTTTNIPTSTSTTTSSSSTSTNTNHVMEGLVSDLAGTELAQDIFYTLKEHDTAMKLHGQVLTEFNASGVERFG